jgi:hypothetical protein
VRFQQIVEKLHIEIVVLDNQHFLGARLAGILIPVHQLRRHYRVTPKLAPIGAG